MDSVGVNLLGKGEHKVKLPPSPTSSFPHLQEITGRIALAVSRAREKKRGQNNQKTFHWELRNQRLFSCGLLPKCSFTWVVKETSGYELSLDLGLVGKESACSVRDLASFPVLGRSPGGGHDNPLQYSCLENPHGLRSLVGYSPCGCTELDTTEQRSTDSTWIESKLVPGWYQLLSTIKLCLTEATADFLVGESIFLLGFENSSSKFSRACN